MRRLKKEEGEWWKEINLGGKSIRYIDLADSSKMERCNEYEVFGFQIYVIYNYMGIALN